MIEKIIFCLFVIIYQIKSQNNEDPLVIHVVPHSHDDIGWLATMDEYFQGVYAQGDRADVNKTITTMVEALISNPSRKFVQVEMAFFTMWWKEQTIQKKDQVRDLISKGQLQMINGGWSQNDEATTYYENIIENMFVGHRFLLRDLNVVPNIGWSIDPFGHSAIQASLFEQMGFDGWWFSRIDLNDKAKRLKEKSMEMIMNPPLLSKKEHSIFTAVNYYHYMSPPGFCFDVFCHDGQVEDYNLDRKSREFVHYFEQMSKNFKTKHLLHTFGSDFQFTDSERFFRNLDKIIDYINQNPSKFPNTQVKYSTPGDYLLDINKLNVEFPEEKNDFFPYADRDHAYWTGYFTSRPSVKGAVREVGKKFQSLRTYLALLRYHAKSEICEGDEDQIDFKIQKMEEAVGVLQHHDAVTGTEKQHVSQDYMKILYEAYGGLHSVMNKIIPEQIFKEYGIKMMGQQFLYQWNSTSQNNNEILKNFEKQIFMTVYNPTVTKEKIFKFKVPHAQFEVINMITNEYVNCEVFCYGKDDKECDAFIKTDLIGYALNLFLINSNERPSNTFKIVPEKLEEQHSEKVYNFGHDQNIKISGNSDYIHYKYCLSTEKCINEKFSATYNYYESYQWGSQSSGAYIFRPQGQSQHGSVPYSHTKSKQFFNGKIASILDIQGDKVDQQLIFKHYSDIRKSAVIEIETFVKSIDVQDRQGKEVVLQINSDVKNADIFYTDQNGLELIQRKLNFRPTWKHQESEPISGNYYPVNLMIQIRDSERFISLLNDRSQGGSSLQNGQIELMIHRRMIADDARGVQEALNEREETSYDGLQQKIRHQLIFGSTNNEHSEKLPRKQQMEFDTEELIYFSQSDQKVAESRFRNGKMKLLDHITEDVKLNMRYYLSQKGNEFLLRLQNMQEQDKSIFKSEFSTIQETTLTANQLLSEWNRKKLLWNGKERQSSQDVINDGNQESFGNKHQMLSGINAKNFNEDITLQPLEIRTFNITTSYK